MKKHTFVRPLVPVIVATLFAGLLALGGLSALAESDSTVLDPVPSVAVPKAAPSRPLPAQTRISLDLQEIEIRELIRLLGEQAGATIFADPSVKGSAYIHAENLPFEEALRAVLEPQGYAFQRIALPSSAAAGAVLIVGDTGQTEQAAPEAPGYRYLVYDPSVSRRMLIAFSEGKLTLDVQRFALRDVLADIARNTGRSIVPIGYADEMITVAIQGLPFDEALSEIARAGGHKVKREGDGAEAVYRVYAAAESVPISAANGGEPLPPYEITLLPDSRVRIRAANAPLASVLLEIGAKCGISVVVAPEITELSTGYIEAAAPADAIRSLVERSGLRVLGDASSFTITRSSDDRLSLFIKDGLANVNAYAASVREVMSRLTVAAELPALAFEPNVEGTVSIHLRNAQPRDALDRIADAAGLRLDERRGVIQVIDRAKEKRIRVVQSGGLIALDIQNAPLSEVLREFGSRTGVNASAAGADSVISLSAQSLTIIAALRTIAEAVGLGVAEEADRFRLVPPSAAPRGIVKATVENGMLSLEAKDAELTQLARVLAEASKQNFIVETGAIGTVSGDLKDVPFQAGLRTFLSSKGYRLRKTAGIYRITPSGVAATPEASANYEVLYENGRLSVDVTNADLGGLLRQIAEEAGMSLALYGAIRDKVNVIIRNEPLDTGLKKILGGTSLGFLVSDSTLTVGDISQPGNPMAALALTQEVIPLKYFSAVEAMPLLPPEVPSGQVRAMKGQNALLVVGRPEMIARAKQFVEEIDKKPQLIEIEALLVEYQDVKSFNHNLSSLIVTGTSPDAATFNPAGGTLSFTYTELRNFNNPQFQGALTSLVEKGKAKIRARPSIATVSGLEAKINVQSSENFRVTQPSSSQGVPLVQIQTITSGITLKITPYVSDAGDVVTIDLFLEDSSPGDRTSDGLPAIATRNAQNRFLVRSDHTAVIGGLIREQTAHNKGGLPILSEIPIIGGLFGRQYDLNRESTLVFYITPRIVDSETKLAEKFQKQGVKVEDAALPAVVADTTAVVPETADGASPSWGDNAI